MMGSGGAGGSGAGGGSSSVAVVYERDCPFELRSLDAASDDGPDGGGRHDTNTVRISVEGEEGAPRSVTVELSSESDLFLHFTRVLTAEDFAEVQDQQSLRVEFSEFAAVLQSSFDSVIQQPRVHLAVFVMQKSGHARLNFIQNMNYKFVELLHLAFETSPQDAVRRSITQRYNSMKARLAVSQARMADLQDVVKVKNPSLMKLWIANQKRSGN
jgi:glycogen debranching enzyme